MATRRPRVPKSSQRALVEAGLAHGRPAERGTAASSQFAGTAPAPGSAPRSHVGGYSAKVIPLDAAPSLHTGDTPDPSAPPAGRTGRPGAAGWSRATGREELTAVDGGEARAERAGTADRDTRTDRDGSAGRDGGAGRDARVDPAGQFGRRRTTPATAPALTPAERRAAARRDLLRRARPGGTPAGRARRPQAPAAAVEPVPARHFSGHSVALLVVLFVAAVLLAPTLRVFLDQQAELRAVQEDIAAQREEQRELTDQIARWDDPAYIQQQARDRFNLVMPGEKTYMVIGGDEAAEDPVPAPASPSEVNPDMPWADALWDSVVRAGTD